MYKKLGVLGGMGPSATLNLYKSLIEGRGAVADQGHINMVLLNDSTIPDRTEAILGNGASPLPALISDCKRLCDAGCDVIAIPCNTSHYYYDELQASCEVPIINMIEATINRLVKYQAKKAYLLATSGTIRTEIYKKNAAKSSIFFDDTSDPEIELMMEVIYAIKAGKSYRCDAFFEMIHEHLVNGADRIILGCTELSLIDFPADIVERIVDSSAVLRDEILLLFA